MEIRFKKCGISNQPDVCIFDDPCLSKFGALRGSCPHPGRQFVGHAPVGLSKRGRDTKSDADIQPEEMLTFFDFAGSVDGTFVEKNACISSG